MKRTCNEMTPFENTSMKENGGLANAKMYTFFEQNIEPGRASTIT